MAGGTGLTGGSISLVNGAPNTLTLNSTGGGNALVLGGAAAGSPSNLTFEISGGSSSAIIINAPIQTCWSMPAAAM